MSALRGVVTNRQDENAPLEISKEQLQKIFDENPNITPEETIQTELAAKSTEYNYILIPQVITGDELRSGFNKQYKAAMSQSHVIPDRCPSSQKKHPQK